MTITTGDIIVSLSFTFMGVMWFLYMKYVIWERNSLKPSKSKKIPRTIAEVNTSNIKDEKLRELIISSRSGVNESGNFIKLIKHTSNIDLEQSDGFIRFNPEDVYEIKKVMFELKDDDDIDIIYKIERLSDGIEIVFSAGLVKEFMTGIDTKKIFSELNK